MCFPASTADFSYNFEYTLNLKYECKCWIYTAVYVHFFCLPALQEWDVFTGSVVGEVFRKEVSCQRLNCWFLCYCFFVFFVYVCFKVCLSKVCKLWSHIEKETQKIELGGWILLVATWLIVSLIVQLDPDQEAGHDLLLGRDPNGQRHVTVDTEFKFKFKWSEKLL